MLFCLRIPLFLKPCGRFKEAGDVIFDPQQPSEISRTDLLVPTLPVEEME